MSKRRTYENKTEELLEPVIKEHNYDLYDVEYIKEGSNWYLRVYIDKEGGVNIDDCEIVSRFLSEELDEYDFIADSYILEVSSPGLGRKLTKDRHFEKSIGEEIEIKLYNAIDNMKEWTGTLLAYDKDDISIELEDQSKKNIPRSSIASVRLSFDF